MKTNTLSLLAYKVAPNTFDLSSRLVHISLRDQIIRGTILVRDLDRGAQIRANDEILIVGAGAAGISAALRADSVGCKVLVLETASEPFSLQSNVTTRYIGPYLYEWPSDVHSDQEYPPNSNSVLDAWNVSGNSGLRVGFNAPVSADTLATEWRKQLAARVGNITILTKVARDASARGICKWLRRHKWGVWPKSNRPIKFSGIDWNGDAARAIKRTEFFSPKFVILAAGTGAERTRWIRADSDRKGHPEFVGRHFWEDDQLQTKFCGYVSKPRIAVLGGGDGALQDTIRCLFHETTPLDTLDHLLASDAHIKGTLERVFRRILAIEQQRAASQSWVCEGGTEQDLAALHEAYLREIRPLAKDMSICEPLLKMLRKDVKNVNLVIRENWLGKAYSLNRFLILLVNECQKNHTEVGAVKLEIFYDSEVTRIDGTIPSLDLEIRKTGKAPSQIRGIMHLSVRFGVDADSAPGQQIGISYQDSTNRRELANIPQPLFPTE